MESLSLSSQKPATGGCTFDETGQHFTHQYWKRCLDCFPDETTGACLSCIAVCHAGHNIDTELRTGNFYCDCGSKGNPTCKLTTGPKYGRDIPNRGPLPPRNFFDPPYHYHRPDLKFKPLRCEQCGARFISDICENGHKMQIRPRPPQDPHRFIPEPWWPRPGSGDVYIDPIIHDDLVPNLGLEPKGHFDT